MVLIFSEHFLGVWGLIIGIPIFIFLLDVLDVTSDEMEKDVGEVRKSIDVRCFFFIT